MEDVINFVLLYKEAVVTFVSAMVALMSAVLARNETRKQRNLMRETLRQRLDEGSLQWGDEAINALAEAEGVAGLTRTTTFGENRMRVAQELSALADRGRMFFPNIVEGKKGSEKEAAFRGSRPPILEALIFAHMELKGINPPHEGNPDFINRCRRLVVSELQSHLDPDQRDAIVGRYDRKREANHKDASRRASTLRAELESKRPYMFNQETDE